MATRTEEYRRRAEQCEQAAKVAADLIARRSYVDMALFCGSLWQCLKRPTNQSLLVELRS